MKKKVWGQLSSIDLNGCNNLKLKDKKLLKQFCLKLCKEIKMVPYKRTIIHRFGEGKLEGYSLMQFIQTSSIIAHLDEVDNRAFIDIFSCKLFNANKAKLFCKKFFNASKAKSKTFYRI